MRKRGTAGLAGAAQPARRAVSADGVRSGGGAAGGCARPGPLQK